LKTATSCDETENAREDENGRENESERADESEREDENEIGDEGENKEGESLPSQLAPQVGLAGGLEEYQEMRQEKVNGAPKEGDWQVNEAEKPTWTAEGSL